MRHVAMRLRALPECSAPSWSSKKPILFTQGNDAQGAFDVVGAQRHIGVGEEHFKADAMIACMAHHLYKRIVGQSALVGKLIAVHA